MQLPDKFLERCLTFLVIFSALVLISSPALAQDTVEVGVTRAMEQVINAIDPTGGTLPLNAGELSVRFENVSNDTRYSFAAQKSTTVDTGWDMSNTTDTTTLEGSGNVAVFGETTTISAGDSIVRALQVVNLGNNYVNIDFSAIHQLLVGSDTFNVELSYADGQYTASDFGGAADTTLVASGNQTADGDIVGWTMGERKTIFLVVEADSIATEGDLSKSEFEITNNAPVTSPSTTGDAWERGVPIDVDDTYDTQTGVFWTEVAGPVISLTKTQTVGDARPGDTIVYDINVSNDGSDTAYNVDIVDAVPQFASYQGTYDPGVSDTVYVETTLSGESWTEISNYTGNDTDVAKLRWHYEELSYPTSGNNSDTVGFTVTID